MIDTLLIVEDQRDLAELVALHLEDVARTIHICADGTTALKRAAATTPDLVILDLGLPGLDGLEVCRRLRAQPRYVPILMLTARSSDAERVLGLEMGADDYLVKPFNVMELVARAKAILRRMEGLARNEEGKNRIEAGRLAIDASTRKAMVDGEEVALTAKEFDLLVHFARNPGRVYTREQLLDAVWGRDVYVEPRTVDVHIRRLRKALEPTGHDRLVETVRGAGYRFSAQPL